jgi:adenylate cyclase
MDPRPANRHLAAILIADVVGYTRLMERDEGATHERMHEIREKVTDPRIAEYGGRIVKTAGDGMLVEFPSTTAALCCAVEIQREMGHQNLYVASDTKIEFRIGINLGDILVDGTDIAGDGVNVASRLETLAEPGGICIAGRFPPTPSVNNGSQVSILPWKYRRNTSGAPVSFPNRR